MKGISLFAGIGGFDQALESIGGEVVFANDLDKNAEKTYNLNHKNPMYLGDITELDASIIPEADILMAGFPCQAFSIAGKQEGFEDDRGEVFFDLLRIINETGVDTILLENVKNLQSHDKGRTFKVIKRSLESIGFHIKVKVLNSKDYGNTPQNRERVYIVGFKDKEKLDRFEFPNPIPLEKNIYDIKELEIEEKYFYTKDSFKQYDLLEEGVTNPDTFYQWRRKYVRENMNNVCPTLTANMGTGGHNVPLILDKDRIRKLTPRECFRLQTFSDNYKLPELANCHLYKQIGNAVTVNVIKRILEKMEEVK